MNDIKKSKLKTIAYEYLFNYFGGDVFKGKIITGASIQLSIKAYKDGKEVKFEKEPNKDGCYYDKNYKVSFDKDKLFVIKKNTEVDKFYRTVYGWDKIEYEIIGYCLDYLDKAPKDFIEKIPTEFRDLPFSTSMMVSKEEFEAFLRTHIDDFNISDNINAQVPSVIFI